MICTVAADMDNVVRAEDLSREFEKVVERVVGAIGSSFAAPTNDRMDDVARAECQVDTCAKAYVAGRCERSLWLRVLDDYEKSWLSAAGHVFRPDIPTAQSMAA